MPYDPVREAARSSPTVDHPTLPFHDGRANGTYNHHDGPSHSSGYSQSYTSAPSNSPLGITLGPERGREPPPRRVNSLAHILTSDEEPAVHRSESSASSLTANNTPPSRLSPASSRPISSEDTHPRAPIPIQSTSTHFYRPATDIDPITLPSSERRQQNDQYPAHPTRVSLSPIATKTSFPARNPEAILSFPHRPRQSQSPISHRNSPLPDPEDILSYPHRPSASPVSYRGTPLTLSPVQSLRQSFDERPTTTKQPVIAPLRPSPSPPHRRSPSPPPMPTQVSRPPTTQPLRYEPRNRKTPAGSVLEPLTPAELETYKHSRNPLRIKSTDSITLPSLEEREEVRNTGVLKRRRDGPEDLEPPSKRLKDSVLVAEHYNARQDVGIQQRLESPIIGLKSFNNWIKSVLIAKWAAPSLVPANGRRTNAMFGKILDLGCGKGGDLQKWQKARVKEYYGLDIAATSVEQARFRHQSFRPSQRFHAVFQALDCYSHPLSDVLGPDVLSSPFDVVSMQFCMHYAFQNLAKVRQMLDNVSRWLRVGGRFVGTIPNSEQLLERLKGLPSDAEELSFGNAVYKIQFDNRDIQTYGQRYSFFLKDAVEDVPEYVVHWDNFVELAKEYGLHLLIRKEFHEVFQEEQEHADYGPLLKRMKVVDAQGVSQMDEDQWEAANIYIVFAFEKR